MAALAGWLDARAAGGEWLLRIEDLDTPRNRPGAEDAIRRTLERLGLAWDGVVRVQSREVGAYRAALDALIDGGHAYPCTCTRTEIAAAPTHAGIEGPVYPGTCRAGLPPGRGARAWRVRVDDRETCFDDRIRGRIAQNLESGVGSDADITRINEVSAQIMGRSFCALGDAAATPFPGAIKYFADEIALGTRTAAADLYDPVAATVFAGVNA